MSTPLTTETILIEFAKTVKATHFYPEGHPNLEAVLERTFNLLKETIKEKGNIIWIVERTGFLEGKLPIGRRHRPLEGLAKDMFFKKIREITFTPDATLKEWKGLFFILTMDGDSLKKAGGLEKLLITKEIKGIQLNEMKYEDIRKSILELEENKTKEDMELGQEEELLEEKSSKNAAQEAGQEEDIIHKIEDHLKAVEKKEKTIETLLGELENEQNTLAYQTIVNKIIKKTESLNWDGLFPVLAAFTAHSNSKSRRKIEQMNIASEQLKKLLTPEITDYLVARLCNRKEDRRDELQQMLKLLGEEAMKHLLNALIDTEDAYARRQIFNALTLFGEAVRLEAENCLNDERWFVVRQMVSLLGEIGGLKSLNAIKTVYNYKDVRVKKEVLKTLGRIPSNESSTFLLERLNDNNPSLKLQAIISLGVLKEQTAIEPLGRLALKRDLFNENIEIRKEAIRSLGMIGGDKAITVLKNLLKKRVFWGKKQNDEIRSLAAISLGRIGGRDVRDILEAVSNASRGLVRLACKKAMEGITIGD
ncbi:MAG: HEAT repeat domain-containing protein [Deltaproteobacteria bacterium]|nr:HEAT repeat domain-containing protein [Deltaproteobacteria bacterium]